MPAPAVPPCRILLVDDEPMLAKLLTRGLQHAGFDVTTFTSSVLALGMLHSGAVFDVIVSDVSMPEVNGRIIAQVALAQHHNPAVVLITGFQEPDVTAPVLTVLRKPFPVGTLVEAVRRVVALRPCDAGTPDPDPARRAS